MVIFYPLAAISAYKLSGGEVFEISAMASAGIPHDSMAMIHWSRVNLPFDFDRSCSSFFLWPDSVLLHLSYSILIISPKDLYYPNGPNIFSKSFLCYSNSFKNPSKFPIFSHHPFFFIMAKTLLMMFLRFDPPPAFEGRPPSWMMMKAVLVWSRMTKSSLIGSMAFLTV